MSIDRVANLGSLEFDTTVIIRIDDTQFFNYNFAVDPSVKDAIAFDTADSTYKKYDASVATHQFVGILLDINTTTDEQLLLTAGKVDVLEIGIDNYAGNEVAVAREMRMLGVHTS